MSAAAFTIIAKNYLPMARVMMASLRRVAPEVRRIAVLVDRPDGYFDPAREDFEVILSEDLPIPQSRWFHFKYGILELATAVKPYAAQHIFERYGVDRLLFFDPDVQIYGDVQPLLDALDDHSIVLTPHLTAPLEDDRRPTDLDILLSGSYNLGFIGIRNCEESARFIEWWQKKVYEQCVVDLAKGLFVDQRWVDLVPGLFSGVGILRDPGLNVAYWNIAQRRIQRSPQGYLVNGRPLFFFHFSGFDPDQPYTFSRHQDRLTLDDLGDARELVLQYRQLLYESGYAKCKEWPYAFGVFENGFPIPDVGRPAHHESADLVTRIADPFSEEGYRAFLEIWNKPVARPDGSSSGVTRLAYRIYKARPDVQTAMPDIFHGDLLRFMEWVVSSGKTEHNLSDVFIAPIWDAARIRKAGQSRYAAKGPQAGGDPALNEKVMLMLAKSGIRVGDEGPIQVEALNQLVGNGTAKLHLSQLAMAIYNSRPDLQHRFPDPCDRDGARFLGWFLTYGAREYRLAEVLIAPMRRQWDAVVQSQGDPLRRLWFRSSHAVLGASLSLRSRLEPLAGRMRLARTLAAMKWEAIREPGEPDGIASPEASPNGAESAGEGRPGGVNFIGYVRSEMGVGESVRCAVRAARSCGLRIAVKSVDADGPYRLNDHSIAELKSECPYAVNVLHVNADQSDLIVEKLGSRFTRTRYNIGYWAWELEEFPRRWAQAFQHFDEIWTPSAFSQTAIARRSPIPVVRIPHAIQVADCAHVDRAAFSIPANAFVFLSIFDLLSVFERKNPLGVLRAFRSAFGQTRDCHLVMKVNHGGQRPAEMLRIREAAAGLPVTIIDRTIDRSHINGLIQMCDCLVSLHRSEGFGLTLAESMYLGKPVIATAYSGNLDFTRRDNSFLVDYDLAPIPPGCDPYDEGLLWAEPKTEDAVKQLRSVVNSPELRRTRAAKGREYVRAHFAPENVGKLMVERLAVVPSRLQRSIDTPVDALAAPVL